MIKRKFWCHHGSYGDWWEMGQKGTTQSFVCSQRCLQRFPAASERYKRRTQSCHLYQCLLLYCDYYDYCYTTRTGITVILEMLYTVITVILWLLLYWNYCYTVTIFILLLLSWLLYSEYCYTVTTVILKLLSNCVCFWTVITVMTAKLWLLLIILYCDHYYAVIAITL